MNSLTTIRQGLNRAFNTVLAVDAYAEHPTVVHTLDDIEKAIKALNELERDLREYLSHQSETNRMHARCRNVYERLRDMTV